MKILNIFGLVVAVHVVVFLLIFAIPGCRSTTHQPATQTVGLEPDPAFDTTAAPSRGGGDLAAADLNPPLATSDPDAIGYGSSSATGASGRYSPTRPGGEAPLIAPAPLSSGATIESPVQPAKSYTVVGGDSLWSISKRHGTSVRELAAANDLSANAGLRVGQKLIIPGAAESVGAADAATADASYTVKSGDTLGVIARRHNTTVDALKAANNLRGDLLRVGQRLVLPAAASPAAAPSSPAAPSVTTSSANAGQTVRHRVVAGETLGAIARKYGVRVGEIAMANQIADPRLIRVGQDLVIPGWQAPRGGAKAEAPTTPAPARPQPAPAAPAPLRFDEELPAVGEDLDAGLDEEPADVPVIQVEEPVRTITIPPAEGKGSSGGSGDAPRFN